MALLPIFTYKHERIKVERTPQGQKLKTKQGNLFLYIIESLYINLYGLLVVLLIK